MLLKFVQLFCILSIATAQNINATAPSSGATTLSIGVTTVSSTQAPYSNATTPSGNATTPSTTPASSSNTITQSGGSATPSNATTPSGAVIVSFGGLTTSTSDATTLSSAPTISPTFLLPTTNSPYNQTFDDPLDCFIGEHFESNVQLYHIIGVRNVDARFKISAHDENFGIKSFFHSVLVPKPQFPVTSRPLNSTSVSNGSANSSAKGLPTNGTKKSPTQNVGPTTPLNLKGITASWDAKSNTFHFVIPHEGFRRYKIDYSVYVQHASKYGLEFSRLGSFVTSWAIPVPYTCHYNTFSNATVCTAISYDMMKVYYFTSQSNLPRQSTYWIPRYLTYDAFYTYADRYGVDYILIHHKGQWIYRINFQQYYQSRQTFFKVFHLKTPPQNFMFEKFEFADENGLITRYMFVHPNGQRSYRYFYSLFSEVSGLETFCVHNKLINGTLMIMGGVIAAPEKGPAAALRATLGIKKQDTAELHTVLRILFYCATAYLTVFVVVQIIPPRKAAIWRDVRRADREIQRLAPVIENVMARVYVFMENEKKMARKKEKKSK